MKRRTGHVDLAGLALAALLAASVACGRSEKPAPPKVPAPAPAASAAAAPGTSSPPGSLGREVKEGEAKVGDVVKESTGAPPGEIERGKRLPGPTPTPPAGRRGRPRY
jgi:hypothetical protein